MSGQVDEEGLKTSVKVLTVAFISLIGSLNLGLLVKLLLRNGRLLFQSRRNYMVVSLAFGDLLLALFPLVVNAREAFEDFGGSCRLWMISGTYLSYYFPFVYGVALFFLSIELIKRRAIWTIGGSAALASALYCAIPWLLGLVIILPLAWSGLNWNDCEFTGNTNYSRLRALEAVAVIVPSIMTVFGIFIILKIPTPEFLLNHDDEISADTQYTTHDVDNAAFAADHQITSVPQFVNSPIPYATGHPLYHDQWFQTHPDPAGYYPQGPPAYSDESIQNQPAPPSYYQSEPASLPTEIGGPQFGRINIVQSQPGPLLDHDFGTTADAGGSQIAPTAPDNVPSDASIHQTSSAQYKHVNSASPYPQGPQTYSDQWFQTEPDPAGYYPQGPTVYSDESFQNQWAPAGYYQTRYSGHSGQPLPQQATYNTQDRDQPQTFASLSIESSPNAGRTDAVHLSIQTEKCMLVTCFVFYIIFMLPCTIFRMAVVFNEDPPQLDQVTYVALYYGFLWLSLLRGIVLPVISFRSPNPTNNA